MFDFIGEYGMLFVLKREMVSRHEGVFQMNAIAIAAPVSSANRDDLRVIKVTSLKQVSILGNDFFIELHDEKGTILPIRSVNFNTEDLVKNWEGNDGVTLQIEGRGTIHLIAGGDAGKNPDRQNPKYPVFKILNRFGNEVTKRVTIFARKGVPTTPTEIKMAAPPVEDMIEILDTVEATQAEMEEIVTEVTAVTIPPVPNKDDYATFGEWMNACKARKKALREAGLDA